MALTASRKTIAFFGGALALSVAAAACGGGGGSSQSAGAASKATAPASAATTAPAGPAVNVDGWKVPKMYVRYLNDPALQDSVTTKTCHKGATKLTYWAWSGGPYVNENLYNLTHPGVCIVNVNLPSTSEYTKLLATFKANGAGAPDMSSLQQFDLSNAELSKGLLNLAPYGAADTKSDYVSWAWKMMQDHGAIYGMAQDSAPLGLMYNSTLFKKYGLTVPKTWAQFATEAVAVHKAHPSVYLGDMATIPEEPLLYWQTGAYPVKWTGGQSLQQNYDLPAANKAAQYWQKLYDTGALANISTNGSYKAEADGTLLTDFAASWYPDVFTTPGSSAGKWRVADLPQWSAGQNIYPNDGGSLTVVTKYTKHPAQAAAFAIWLETSPAAWYEWVRKPSYLFPTNSATLSNPGFLNLKISLTGPQKVWSAYSQMADHIRSGWQWSPIEPYVETEMGDGLANVLSHKTTLPASLHALQSDAMSDAKSEGFSPSVLAAAG